MKKELLTTGQIKEQYEKGRRNFDNVKASSQSFQGFVLKGCSFKNADMSWPSFDTADLSGCDFTEADLRWGGFRRVDLRNTKFVKANVSYCDFTSATFEDTDFRSADLTASLLFNVNMGAAKIQGANMTWSVTSIMQLSEEGLKFVIEKLQQMGRQIPPELLSHLKLVVLKIHGKKDQLAAMKMAYGRHGLSDKDKSVYTANIAGLEGDINKLYGQLGAAYTRAVNYGVKKEGERKFGYVK